MFSHAIAFAILSLVACQMSPPVETDLLREDKDAAAAEIQRVIIENYVFEDRALTISDTFAVRYGSGFYTDVIGFEDFAERVTTDLVDVSGDRHFKLNYNPGFVAYLRGEQSDESPEAGEPVASPTIDWNLWHARRENFGFARLEVLPGNIGYMKIDFFQPIEWARQSIDAAFAFLSETEALIIDLRENNGGYGPTDAYIASHFFDEGGSVWSSSYERRVDVTESVMLFEEISGERYLERPVYILVSAETFSLAEQLAYGLQQFGKAIIVGETSAGAAHGIDVVAIDENFFLQVPTIRPVHPVTGRDWEAVGVIPDLASDANDAPGVAHRAALDRIIAMEENDRARGVFEAIRDELDD